jgi:hypothetical protein
MGTHLSQLGVGHTPPEILDPLPTRHVRREAERGARADKHIGAFSQHRWQPVPFQAPFCRGTNVIEEMNEGMQLSSSGHWNSLYQSVLLSRKVCEKNCKDVSWLKMLYVEET